MVTKCDDHINFDDMQFFSLSNTFSILAFANKYSLNNKYLLFIILLLNDQLSLNFPLNGQARLPNSGSSLGCHSTAMAWLGQTLDRPGCPVLAQGWVLLPRPFYGEPVLAQARIIIALAKANYPVVAQYWCTKFGCPVLDQARPRHSTLAVPTWDTEKSVDMKQFLDF
ncbi:Protein of unknown function [Cotesia congregata]|uniref:Uncharacterized protein n=1 Tax=Cotesia congregata TaxID=51543 RepID=A0A8J2MM27_COTCN|nr:Protein of unknown function [Cotesia congregata]